MGGKTTMKFRNVHTMFMFKKASPHIIITSDNYITIINLIMNIARGYIEPIFL